MSEERDTEFDATIAGQSIRTKNYRLTDLLLIPIAVAIAFSLASMMRHETEANAQSVVVAKTLADNNAVVAQSLKDSNKLTVDAIREANENTVKALDRMTQEQRKSTDAIREVACLNDPALRNRPDARDVCKRLSRADRN